MAQIRTGCTSAHQLRVDSSCCLAVQSDHYYRYYHSSLWQHNCRSMHLTSLQMVMKYRRKCCQYFRSLKMRKIFTCWQWPFWGALFGVLWDMRSRCIKCQLDFRQQLIRWSLTEVVPLTSANLGTGLERLRLRCVYAPSCVRIQEASVWYAKIAFDVFMVSTAWKKALSFQSSKPRLN